MSADLATRFHEHLESLGIPIEGIGRDDAGGLRIDFAPAATPEQRAQAQAEWLIFDKSPRKRRQLLAIYQDIQALTNADFKKLTAAALVFFVMERPAVAKKFGINIDPTEPE